MLGTYITRVHDESKGDAQVYRPIAFNIAQGLKYFNSIIIV